jgi:hypothetical protein
MMKVTLLDNEGNPFDQEIDLEQMSSVAFSVLHDRIRGSVVESPFLFVSFNSEPKSTVTMGFDKFSNNQASITYRDGVIEGDGFLPIDDANSLIFSVEDFTNKTIEELSHGRMTYGQTAKES